MRSPLRTGFAALLWLAALTPPALYVVHLSSPATAVRAVARTQAVLQTAALIALGLAVIALAFHPPFLPWLRVNGRRWRERLSTDPAPRLEALARLRNFENAPDHLLAGRSYLRQGDAARARAHLARAVALDAEHLPSRLQLGLALAALGDVQGAVEQLANVVQRDEKHGFGEALATLGELLVRGGANDRAVQVLERHEQLFGANPRVSFYKARALRMLDRHDDARSALRDAAQPLAKAHTTPEAALFRARARVALRRGGQR